MAIGPFVVAGRVDERASKAVKMRLHSRKIFVAARRAPGDDIADMQRKGGIERIDAVDQPVEFFVVAGDIVGHVAQRHEVERALLRPPQRRVQTPRVQASERETNLESCIHSRFLPLTSGRRATKKDAGRTSGPALCYLRKGGIAGGLAMGQLCLA